MKTITYHGPADGVRVAGRLIPRGEAVPVPAAVANQAVRQCGKRVTVQDPPSAEGTTEGEG